MANKVRRVSEYDRRNAEMVPVADFWIEGGDLKVTWHDIGPINTIRPYLEGGLMTVDGMVKMADGKAFFNALPVALSYGSSLYVDDIKT